MSGNGAEIEQYRGNWSTDQLKAYFDALREADARAVAAALAAAEKAVDKALAAAALAVEKAETNSEKWRANANEWRDAMNDREMLFAKTEAVNQRFNAIDKALDDLASFRDKSMARNTAYAVSMIVVFSIIAVVLRFLPG